MKKLAFVLLSGCAIFVSFALINMVVPARAFAQSNRVEVSFTYASQRGYSSNQFAVWIEDAQGRYVKTLYATRFTAAGGWKRRANSLPQWVKQSSLAEMGRAQVDALTGPTPKSGSLRYVWDGTDSTGRAVSAGEYRVFVEATLRNENRVLYTAAVKPGEKGPVTAAARYFGSDTAERGMIGPVTVTY
jgi:hypothetical protein